MIRMPDHIEKIGRSIIQHGPYSQRVYLMKLHVPDAGSIRPAMEQLAHENKYGKILAKIPLGCEAEYRQNGYTREAVIPEYFKNGEDAVFMAMYFSADRRKVTDGAEIEEVLSLALKRKQPVEKSKGDGTITTRICGQTDIEEMSRVYLKVFETYPFPIFDTDFLSEAMLNNQARYFCVQRNGRIVALAASEIDWGNRAVEMTDFATLPEYRGQGLAVYLLKEMENSMAKEEMRTAFSIARALSPAMSIVFASNNYDFGGTLYNNTNISGRIQSMNIWYKRLNRLA